MRASIRRHARKEQRTDMPRDKRFLELDALIAEESGHKTKTGHIYRAKVCNLLLRGMPKHRKLSQPERRARYLLENGKLDLYQKEFGA